MSILNADLDEQNLPVTETPIYNKIMELAISVKSLENLVKFLQSELEDSDKSFEQMEKVISQQETAIILLKEEYLKHGHPAFWDPSVTTTLSKPINQMTAGEIIERNKKFANKYAKATSEGTESFPTFEDQLKMYTTKKSNATSTNVGVIYSDTPVLDDTEGETPSTFIFHEDEVINGQEGSTAVSPGGIGPDSEEKDDDIGFSGIGMGLDD